MQITELEHRCAKLHKGVEVDGYRAFAAGKTIKANPHGLIHGQKWDAWRAGWKKGYQDDNG